MSDPTILFSRDAINQLADIVADRLADKLLPMLASQRESQVELTGNTEKYLTRKEVAKSLSITLPTLSVWTKSGKLKFIILSLAFIFTPQKKKKPTVETAGD